MAVSMELHERGTHTMPPCILKIVISSPIKSIITVKRIFTREKIFPQQPTNLYPIHSSELLRQFSKPYSLLMLQRAVEECPQEVSGRQEEKQGG